MNRIFRWLLDLLQRRCLHQGHVAADILEGELVHTPPKPGDIEVQWCSTCGAYRFRYSGFEGRTAWRNREGEWRRPQPLWSKPPSWYRRGVP